MYKVILSKRAQKELIIDDGMRAAFDGIVARIVKEYNDDWDSAPDV